MIKTIPKKKKCKKAKWLSEEALQTAEKRREAKGKREKEIYTHLNAEFQRMERKDKKAFVVITEKKKRKTIEWERLEISSRKLEIPREYFMQVQFSSVHSVESDSLQLHGLQHVSLPCPSPTPRVCSNSCSSSW